MKVYVLYTEADVRRCSTEQLFLKISQKFTGNHLCLSLFFNRVASLGPATLPKKGSSTGILKYFFEDFRNTFFMEHLWVGASEYLIQNTYTLNKLIVSCNLSDFPNYHFLKSNGFQKLGIWKNIRLRTKFYVKFVVQTYRGKF